MSEIKRLSDETEQSAIDMAANGVQFKDIAIKLKFNDASAFLRYRTKFTDFNVRLMNALDAYCIDLEFKLLEIDKHYDNTRMAEVISKNIQQVLKYRNPKRYGDKIDMNVNQTIDITGAIDSATKRIIDVTPNHNNVRQLVDKIKKD